MLNYRVRQISSQTTVQLVGQAFAMWAFFANASGFEQVSTVAVNELTVTHPPAETTFAQISPAMPIHYNLDSANRCNLLNSTWRIVPL